MRFTRLLCNDIPDNVHEAVLGYGENSWPISTPSHSRVMKTADEMGHCYLPVLFVLNAPPLLSLQRRTQNLPELQLAGRKYLCTARSLAYRRTRPQRALSQDVNTSEQPDETRKTHTAPDTRNHPHAHLWTDELAATGLSLVVRPPFRRAAPSRDLAWLVLWYLRLDALSVK